jgi:hypothetical protein
LSMRFQLRKKRHFLFPLEARATNCRFVRIGRVRRVSRLAALRRVRPARAIIKQREAGLVATEVCVSVRWIGTLRFICFILEASAMLGILSRPTSAGKENARKENAREFALISV